MDYKTGFTDMEWNLKKNVINQLPTVLVLLLN